ncbi:hypothetical protein [Tessaracoccus oleiagri]|uniref:KDPG and KHG aldolase n=1 Tax=Tessaracoccus oleiagri TaxID=686624 RepID=A0A1G9H157_9ACTN|nr:hypothetical protein [Tessaracoccus oleiagri]SDL06670.1 KDPG and KHG aldolase [Tessaracoccus oleiagri]
MTVPSGIVTCLPAADIDDLVGVVEVLVQEQLPVFAAPVDSLRELGQVFGPRAVFGAWQVADREGLEAAHGAGAEFVLADVVDRELAWYADSEGLTVFGSATTHLEVRAVLELGLTGALLWPADIVGHVMAGHLARVGLAERVIPMGGVGAFAAGEWMKHGSPAACVDATLLGDAVDGGDLGQLRDRCASFRKAAQRAVEHRGSVAAASS